MIDKLALCCIVLFHASMVGANLLAFFLVPFLEPWFVAAPIMSLVLLLTFSKVLDCPLTNLENYHRKRLGMKRIGGFVGHYFLKPIRKRHGRKKEEGCEKEGWTELRMAEEEECRTG